jgi:hypothetical protein
LSDCEHKQDTLVAKINQLKTEMHKDNWFGKIIDAIEIAGIGIAVGAVYIGIGACKVLVSQDQGDIKDDNKSIAADKMALEYDPGLSNKLKVLASGNNVMHQAADENVTGYNSTVKNIQGFDKSIDGILRALEDAGRGSHR